MGAASCAAAMAVGFIEASRTQVTAEFRMALRSAAGVVARFARLPLGVQGGSWVARPATWGAAAEVPKKELENSPAPVTWIPLTAVIFGLVAPLLVGLWLLLGSMSSMLWSVARMASTETIPPPASDWAGTLLRSAVKLKTCLARNHRGVALTGRRKTAPLGVIPILP